MLTFKVYICSVSSILYRDRAVDEADNCSMLHAYAMLGLTLCTIVVHLDL